MSKLNTYLMGAGFSARKFLNYLRGTPRFIKNYNEFKRQLPRNQAFKISSLHPNTGDMFDEAGSLPLHYFYQDLYIASKVFISNPGKHVDIGSRVDGFTAHVASFREIEVFDIRTLENSIPGVKFIQADLMSTDFPFENYTDSVSSLHAIEHFGLGRYGDPVDVNGYLKGLDNIFKLLIKGGIFYFSVPIGPQRIEFDAHRVFSLPYLFSLFKERYEMVSFSYIDDKNVFYPEVPLDPEKAADNYGCNYGCGIFILKKL